MRKSWRTEGFYVFYWYVVVLAVKESPKLYGDSYISWLSADIPENRRIISD
jgi:hypothetical protein